MPRSRRRIGKRRTAGVLAAGLAALALVLVAWTSGATLPERLGAMVFDGYQRLKPREHAGAPVLVVDIDEASLAELGQWPWPRSRLADLVDRLGLLGAAAIGFDMVFAEPDRTSLGTAVATLEGLGAKIELPERTVALDNDAVLAAAYQRNPVVSGLILTSANRQPPPQPKAGFAHGGEDPRRFLPSYSGSVSNLDMLDTAASGLGFFSFPPAPDGVVRRIQAIARAQDHLYPALSVEALRVAQQAGAIQLRATGASGEAATGTSALTAVKVGAFEAPLGPGGSIPVYYSGIAGNNMLPAHQLIGDEADWPALRERVEGHIVLVGSSAVGLRDLVATPLAAGVPGVKVHAEVIDQFFSKNFLSRPDWAPGAEISLAIVLSLLILALLPRHSPLAGSIYALFAIASVVLVSWIAFAQYQLLIDPVLPAAAIAATHVVATVMLLIFTESERQFVRNAFSRYLAPSLVNQLADDPRGLVLGGETRELTLLFCDIRGFTSLSEGLEPDELTTLLNGFLTPMTDVLLARSATVDKYMGDAIMAFWNAPIDVDDHPRQACLAALEMTQALDSLNETLERPIRIGIGLNTGECCVGNLGSKRRFNYSAIGDAVNAASRIEGLTKQYGLAILIAEDTARRAEGLALVEVDRVRVVGRDAPISVHTVLGDETMAADAGFNDFLQRHGAMLERYRSGDFDGADAALADAEALRPAALEALYGVYRQRLSQFRQAPPPPDWDGVFSAEEK